jgi:hypothetical protein
MRRVILESPYAGDVPANVDYARQCLRDSLLRGEAPIASHLLYTQPGVLRDDDKTERAMGIAAGLAWGVTADATVVYSQPSHEARMRRGIDRAKVESRENKYRHLNNYQP